jgi:hypothetical protein
MKDDLTKRVDALYHRGLSWPLAVDLQKSGNLALLAHLEQMNDDELWQLVRLPQLLDADDD